MSARLGLAGLTLTRRGVVVVDTLWVLLGLLVILSPAWAPAVVAALP